MSYQSMVEAAQSNKHIEKVGRNIIKLDKEGQKIIGRLTGVESVTSKQYKNETTLYTFDTDDGIVSVFLGQAADKTIKENLVIDDVYMIEYKGDKPLDGKRRVKIYDVFHITKEEDEK